MTSFFVKGIGEVIGKRRGKNQKLNNNNKKKESK
jgi:hypothetical protein